MPFCEIPPPVSFGIQVVGIDALAEGVAQWAFNLQL